MNGCFAIWRYRNEINGMKWFIELSVPNGSEWGRHVTALIEFHQISSFLRVNDWNWLKLMNRFALLGCNHCVFIQLMPAFIHGTWDEVNEAAINEWYMERRQWNQIISIHEWRMKWNWLIYMPKWDMCEWNQSIKLN